MIHLSAKHHAPLIDVGDDFDYVDDSDYDDDRPAAWGDAGNEFRCETCFALPPADHVGTCRFCGADGGREPITGAQQRYVDAFDDDEVPF